MDARPWRVEFYHDARGKSPVEEFLASLPARERAALFRALQLLEMLGPALGMPHARPIEGLWELRAGAGRAFYVAMKGRRFVVLHGYRKKSQRAPRQEIETALRRWEDLLWREK
jgi:phage-related protein